MLSTKLIAATLATSLTIVPASQAVADGKDFIAGAIIGGVVGSQIQKQQQRKKYTAPRAPQQNAYVAPTTPKKSYRQTIPATQEGRQIQSALNYFGFNAGTVDGQVGRTTRAAIGGYQTYLGYPSTGSLNTFEQELLVSSYNRALAGGDQTFAQIAAQPDGTRGLLKLYRSEIASGSGQTAQPPALTPAPTLPQDIVSDI